MIFRFVNKSGRMPAIAGEGACAFSYKAIGESSPHGAVCRYWVSGFRCQETAALSPETFKIAVRAASIDNKLSMRCRLGPKAHNNGVAYRFNF
jgi:hypothetical protein